MNLKTLVSQALSEASVKLASAEDVTIPPVSEPDYGLYKFASDEDDEKEEKPPPFPPKKSDEDDDEDESETKEAALDDARYAMKLAEALDASLAYLTVKAASEENTASAAPGSATNHTTAPGGLKVMEGGHREEEAKTPTAKSIVAQDVTPAPGTTEDRNDGNSTGLATNRDDYGDPDWTKNKEAALAVLESKITQAETLASLGHTKQASALASQARAEYDKVAKEEKTHQKGRFRRFSESPGEQAGTTGLLMSGIGGALGNAHGGSPKARALKAAGGALVGGAAGAGLGALGAYQNRVLFQAADAMRGSKGVDKKASINYAGMVISKVAADPSSPQASLPAHNESFRLSTKSEHNPTHFPNNEDVAKLTKRDAQTKSTREGVSEFLRETANSAKSDNAIQTHLEHFLGGEKISSLQGSATRALLRKLASADNDPEASEEDKEKARKLRAALEEKKKESARSSFLQPA